MNGDFSLRDSDPFANPDLWTKSSLLSHIDAADIETLPELSLPNTSWPEHATSIPDNITAKTEVETFNSQNILPATPVELIEEIPNLSSNDDTWSFSSTDILSPRVISARTWEQFADPAFKDPFKYLSDGGPLVFDAVLLHRVKSQQPDRPLKPDIFLKSLFQLGLGRDSPLFAFRKDGSYCCKLPGARLSGTTLQSTTSVVSAFGRCGQLFRSLKAQGQAMYEKQRYSATSIAVAQITTSILLELEAVIAGKRPLASLLSLQAAFRLPCMVLTMLTEMQQGMKSLEQDTHVLSYLFDFAQGVERAEPCLNSLMLEVLAHASKPWLESLSGCVGLAPSTTASEHLRQSLEEAVDAEQDGSEEIDKELFPRFFSKTDRRLVVQIYQGEKMITGQSRHPGTCSIGPTGLAVHEPLCWRFSWEAVVQVEREINIPAKTLIKPDFVAQYSEDSSILSNSNEPDHTQMLQGSYAIFEASMGSSSNDQRSRVRSILLQLLNLDDQEKPDQLLTLDIMAASSFQPLLSARVKAVNHACLRLLFGRTTSREGQATENLTYHLRILKRFVLMGDGVFATRLSHALFDPSLASAERTKGRARIGRMGLRLGSRQTWPPASSELQLALMGILTTSFEDDLTHWSRSRSGDLPGELSFALRQLSEEEVERCLDPTSLEALDFLRIQYKPPPPLDAVIQPSCLDKYDAVLKLLMRLTRLLFVTNHSMRSPTQRSPSAAGIASRDRCSATFRFRHAAHHFVTGFVDYVLTTAIGSNWESFMRKIIDMETSVTRADGSSGRGTDHRGVEYIRELHEGTLDAMLFACLLRRRHKKVHTLLEDIFRLILRFSGLQEPMQENEEEVAEMYRSFTRQVGTFITVCKGLAARRDYSAEGEEKGLHALITRLTMNDFYSSKLERALKA